MNARAAIYTRISDKDPRVEAMADQEKRCRVLAAREGYEVVTVLSDDGISAWSGKARPGWLKLTDGIRGKKFDVILAVAEDRFARSSEEKMGLQSACVQAGIIWHTIGGGRVDPATAGGALMSTITGAVAQYESTIKSERVRGSVERRLAKGEALGGARAFGYLDSTTVDPEEATLIRDAYRMIKDGSAIYAVAKMLTASDYKTARGGDWTTSTVRAMLKRPRYAGLLAYKGEIVSDTLPGIVSREDWDAVQAILKDPSRGSRKGSPQRHLLSGIARCLTCGAPLIHSVASTKVKGKRYSYDIYRCGKTIAQRGDGRIHVSIRSEGAEDRVVTSVLESIGRGEMPEGITSGDLQDMQAKLSVLADQITRAYDLLLDSSLRGQDKIKNRIRTLEQEVTALEQQRNEALSDGAIGDVFAALRSYVMEAGEGKSWPYMVERDLALQAWDKLGLERQRVILRGGYTITVKPGRGLERVSVKPV